MLAPTVDGQHPAPVEWNHMKSGINQVNFVHCQNHCHPSSTLASVSLTLADPVYPLRSRRRRAALHTGTCGVSESDTSGHFIFAINHQRYGKKNGLQKQRSSCHMGEALSLLRLGDKHKSWRFNSSLDRLIVFLLRPSSANWALLRKNQRGSWRFGKSCQSMSVCQSAGTPGCAGGGGWCH